MIAGAFPIQPLGRSRPYFRGTIGLWGLYSAFILGRSTWNGPASVGNTPLCYRRRRCGAIVLTKHTVAPSTCRDSGLVQVLLSVALDGLRQVQAQPWMPPSVTGIGFRDRPLGAFSVPPLFSSPALVGLPEPEIRQQCFCPSRGDELNIDDPWGGGRRQACFGGAPFSCVESCRNRTSG